MLYFITYQTKCNEKDSYIVLWEIWSAYFKHNKFNNYFKYGIKINNLISIIIYYTVHIYYSYNKIKLLYVQM